MFATCVLCVVVVGCVWLVSEVSVIAGCGCVVC